MGIFVTYPTAIFSNLKNTATTILNADEHPLWVTSLIVCNKGAQPIRFNLQKNRKSGTQLEKSCTLASTANLNATYDNETSGLGATLTNNGTLAAFTIDGITPSVNTRILVKNQSTTFQNGIYNVTVVGDGSTPWVLTRASDYDMPSEIQAGDIINITSGTVNMGTQWEQTATVTTIGTDPVIFVANSKSTITYINQYLINPYSTVDVIGTLGNLNIMYSNTPYISDQLVCYSNGYTQIFDCEVVYSQLNELI
jgi:hypothetical protein